MPQATAKRFTGWVSDDTLAHFKAAAALRRMTMEQAYDEAMRLWIETPQRTSRKNFSETSETCTKNS